MKTNIIFDYSYEPLRCAMFVHEFESIKISDNNIYAGIKHSMFSFGINPIYINLTVTSQWTTTIEIALWKFNITFSIRWWA